MVFNPSNFSFYTSFDGSPYFPTDVIKREWAYTTSDVLADIGSSYFTNSDLTKKVRAGDFIRVTASDGSAVYYIETVNPGSDSTSVHRFS